MNSTFLFYLSAAILLFLFAMALVGLSLLRRFDPDSRRFFRVSAVLLIIATAALPAVAYPLMLERARTTLHLTDLSDRRDDDGTILQSTHYTCAPAALANVAIILGCEINEREMARRCETTPQGTLPAKMIRALGSIGIDGELRRVEPFELARLESPAILFVDHPATGRESHSIVYLGPADHTRDEHQVIDPLHGRLIMGNWELEAIFHGSMIRLESSPNERPSSHSSN